MGGTDFCGPGLARASPTVENDAGKYPNPSSSCRLEPAESKDCRRAAPRSIPSLRTSYLASTTMSLLAFSRAASAWADPVRKLKTLESFARTEEDGGRDIAAALKVVRDPEARKHLERHAKDEIRHANLFRGRAAELRAEGIASKDTEEAG